MSGPRQTMTELDFMDEKLRRLGLSSDATVDPLKGKGREYSEAYMEKIRTEQRDRRRLRREKEYRRYMASDQYAQEGDHGAEAKLVQAAVDSARSLLAEEQRLGDEIVHNRDRKEMETFDRAARLQKVVAIEKNIFEEAKIAAEEVAVRADRDAGASISGMGPFSQLQVGESSKILEKHEYAVELCHEIVHGLVELSFLVSDKRFLLAEELTGKPVRCVEQDLQVSEWNEWVRQCLHKKDAATHDEAPDHVEPNDFRNQTQAPAEAEDSPEHRMAAEQFTFAAQQEEKRECRAQQEAVGQVVSMLHSEGRRLRKLALDDMRREYDRSLEEQPFNLRQSSSEEGRDEIGASVGSFHMPSSPTTGEASTLARPPPPGRVEVLPRWTHRMPPVCAFIHGDELSGVRILTEGIERRVRHAGAKSCGDADAPPPPPAGKAHDKSPAAPPQEKVIGVVQVLDGFKKTFVTPRTLLGRAHPAAAAAAAPGNRAAARHGGGGKGAPHHKLPAEDDERKDFEAMADILAREIVSAHFHNLSLLTNGKVPPIAATQPQVDHTPRRARSNNKKEEAGAPPMAETRDETLHCLYLVGFPENETFYQILEMKLGPSVEAAETEIALEQHRLDEQAAAVLAAAAAAATPGSRGRSHSTSQSPKPKAPPPAAGGNSGRGKGSKNQVVEDAALLVAEQNAGKAFPPLCIVGYFVEYDIPARQQRLKDAYVPLSALPPSSTGAKALQVPPSAPSSPVGLSGCTLMHPVFNPEPPTAAPATITKESSFRIPSEKLPPSANASVKEVQAASGGANAGSRRRVCAMDWDISTVRRELVHRHHRMKKWQTQWRMALSGSTLAAFKRTISNAALPTPREKGPKKRPTKNSPQSTGKEAAPEPPGPESAGAKETFAFPKVLYFFRTLVVNEFMRELPEGTDDDAGATPFFVFNGKPWEMERAKVVETLLQKITDATRPGVNPITNAQLVPNLLPEPLRIADYRLPNELCNDLIRTYNLYDAKLLAEDRQSCGGGAANITGNGNGIASLPQSAGTAAAESGSGSGKPTPALNRSPTSVSGRCMFLHLGEDEMRCAATKMSRLRAEMGVFRAFSLQLKSLLQTVSSEAFPDSIWQGTTDFSSTVHYVSIDKNFAGVQERLQEIDRSHRQQLEWCCAVLFRVVVDDALEATATAMESVCQWIYKAYFATEERTPTATSGPAMSCTNFSIPPTAAQQSLSKGTSVVYPETNSTTNPYATPGHMSVVDTQAGSVSKQPSSDKEMAEPAADSSTLPNHPAPPPAPAPRARRICDEDFRLTQQQTLALLAPLFSRSENGLTRFWESFHPYLHRIRATLEAELSEHIRYFASHVEFQRQAANVPSVALPAAGSTTSLGGPPLTPAGPGAGAGVKDGAANGAKQNGMNKEVSPRRSGKENTVELSQKGTPTTSTTTIPATSNGGSRHADPVAELQWEVHGPQLVRRILCHLFATVDPLPDEIPCPVSTPRQPHASRNAPLSAFDSINNLDSAQEAPDASHLWRDTAVGASSLSDLGATTPPTALDEVRRSVSPTLCRCVVIIKEVMRCVMSAHQSAQKWLDVMYRTALATPPESVYPAAVRPKTLAQLFSVPMVSAVTCASDGLPPCDRGVALDYDWPRLNLELTLCTLSIYGRRELSLDEFMHCAALAQLSKLWIYLERGTGSLAESIGFQRPPSTSPSPLLLCRSPGSPMTSGSDVQSHSPSPSPSPRPRPGLSPTAAAVEAYVTHLPDLLFASSCLTAPCRDLALQGLPFLHLPELRTLFHHSVRGSGEQRKIPKLDLRSWLCEMFARRCCLCQSSSCSYRRAQSLPLPSLRELRRAVAALPESILRSSCTVPLIRPYVSRKTREGVEVRDQGVRIHWWSYEGPDGVDINTPMRRSLTRITTSTYFLSKLGVLRREYPPLPLVLHLFASNGVSVEESICRIFHCLAAIMVPSPEPQCFFEAGGSSSQAVNAVKLSVEEFVHYFGWRADQAGRRPSSDALSLAVDAQLLLQVEGVDKISLATLLSSHWGRCLVAAHLSSKSFSASFSRFSVCAAFVFWGEKIDLLVMVSLRGMHFTLPRTDQGRAPAGESFSALVTAYGTPFELLSLGGRQHDIIAIIVVVVREDAELGTALHCSLTAAQEELTATPDGRATTRVLPSLPRRVASQATIASPYCFDSSPIADRHVAMTTMHAENYKDVIVSQPPAMYGNAHNISLENFKGILLCEKPASDAFAAPVDAKAFVPSNPTGNPLGYGPTDEDALRRKHNDTTRADNLKQHRHQNRQYLSRHKKWLYSFAKAMKKMKEDEVEQEVEMARRAARFRAGEERKREDQLSGQAAKQPAPYDIQNVQTQLSKSGKSGAAKKRKAKPQWAMTEDEALMHEDDSVAELLDFASKLDYEKFITDYTIAEALNVMRDRVEEIAKANNWGPEDIQRAAEEDGDDDLRSAMGGGDGPQFQSSVQRSGTPNGARRALPGGAAAHDKEWDSSTSRGQMLKRAISKDALALADRILENTPSLLKVHTRQSLARVLQKCAMSGESDISEALRRNAELGHMASSELDAATAIGPPLDAAAITTVKVSAESTALEQPQSRRVLVELQHSKEKTQNLPYLYRCPAI
eukprot:gene997-592_t